MPAPLVPPLACIELPALPLQLLQRRLPDGAARPLAVLAGDSRGGPQQVLAWVNAAAAAAGVEPGMSLRAAQGICLPLQAEVVSAAELRAAQAALWRCVLEHSPSVEPAAAAASTLWADPRGLGDAARWQARLRQALHQAGWQAAVRLGFRRFFCRALLLAEGHATGPARPLAPCADAAQERRAALQIPLRCLDLPTAVAAAATELGLARLGDLLRLPATEVRQRLGAAAQALYRALDDRRPVQPRYPQPLATAAQDLEPPTADGAALLAWAQRLLQPLLQALADKGEVACALAVQLCQAGRGGRPKVRHAFWLRTAAPTCLPRLWGELLHLRLQALPLSGPVERLALRLVGQPRRAEQQDLLALRPRRDLQAAARAIARLQAALGAAATTRARLCAEHLPEAQFVWEPSAQIAAPQGGHRGLPAPRQLMRCLLRPRRFTSLAGLQAAHGRVLRWFGPHGLSTRWWEGGIEREYYYALTAQQDVLWLYRDMRAAPAGAVWVLQGILG